MRLVSTTAAVTYTFHSDEPLGGWACCSINEATGELAITSDWGNWAHRWNPKHIGCPSLHAFIGDRGCVDYLAGKLSSKTYAFDPDLTIDAIRELVVEARREGRIDKAQARHLWDEAADHVSDCGDSETLFCERWYSTDLCEALEIQEPWNLTRSSLSREYRDLVDRVLPPLVEVCKAEASKYARAA